MRSRRTSLHRAVALGLVTTIGGCALTLHGPSETSLHTAPDCDTEKPLVAVDGVAAVVSGLASFAAPPMALVAIGYLVSALIGNTRVNACRAAVVAYSRESPEPPEQHQGSFEAAAEKLEPARRAAQAKPAPEASEALEPLPRPALGPACRRIEVAYQTCQSNPLASEHALAEQMEHEEIARKQREGSANAAAEVRRLAAERAAQAEQAKLAAAEKIRLAAAEQVRLDAEQAKRAPVDRSVPAPEIVPSVTIDLPTVPGIARPPVEAGFHHPSELRLDGRALLDTEIKVKGYLVGMCADADPTICARPRLYLGSTTSPQLDRVISVVDVPSPKPPKLALGDYVTVTGTWRSGPVPEDADGVLGFRAIEHARPGTTIATPPKEIVDAIVTIPKTPRVVDEPRAHAASIQLASQANQALRARQLDAAIDAYTKATTAWDGNHVAWFGLGASQAQRGAFGPASAAFQRAAALRPDAAMYHLWLGIALYESTGPGTREPARASLVRATMLEPRLWRAHHYLGRIARDQGRPEVAAESFTRAIQANPHEVGSFIALAELYRSWDHPAEAIVVAMRGVAGTPETPDFAERRSELTYLLAMAYVEAHQDTAALVTFAKALAIRPDHHRARFERGRLSLRLGDLDGARRDLEDVVKVSAPGFELGKQQAAVLLKEIAGKAKRR